MRLRFVRNSQLPEGVTVAVVDGERETVVMLDPKRGLDGLCEDLTATLGQMMNEEWLYVGSTA